MIKFRIEGQLHSVRVEALRQVLAQAVGALGGDRPTARTSK